MIFFKILCKNIFIFHFYDFLINLCYFIRVKMEVVKMEPNSKMDNLLEQLNDELIQMQVTDDYCETDNVKWLFNHIGEQLVIMGITKKSEA